MEVICDVAMNDIYLGTAVIDLTPAETEAYLKWLQYLKDKKVQHTRDAIQAAVAAGVE